MYRLILAAARNAARRSFSTPVLSGLRVAAVRNMHHTATAFKAWPTSRRATLALSAGAGLALLPASAASALAPHEELSFIMIKPDGVHRGLIADIIKRFEQKGYKLVGVKILVPTKELASKHYAENDGKPFFPKLVNFLSSGPVVAMVWEGKDVVKYGRTMIGATNPLASAPGTIRGEYGVDMGRNIIHGSDSVESANREVALWFKQEELADYTPVATPWIYE